jgi:hypothetical protein
MLSHIAEGFLRHTIQLVLDFFRELVRPSAHVQRAMNSTVTRKAFGELAERVGQIRAFERLWPQSEQHSARVFQTALGELSDAGETFGDIHRFVRAVGGLEVEQNARELLNERVMNLTGQPVAFLYDGGVGKSFRDTSIARFRNRASRGAVEIPEASIYFTDSPHCEFPLLPM